MTDWQTIDNQLLDPNWYTTTEYHEVLRTLRNEDPVHWTENEQYGRNHWTLTRYDDVKEYLLAPELFSSRWDTRIPRSPKRRTPEERHAQGWDISIATNDNPMHDVYRAPINKHFSVPAIGRLGHDVAGIVDEIINDVAERGECDLVEDIAAEVPVKVILRMLGVPVGDWDYIREASWQWLAASDPRWMIDGDEVKTSMIGLNKLIEYCEALAMERRKNPQDDFATVVGNLQIDGDQLSVHEMRTWFTTMIGGGLETTRNAAAVGIWVLLQNPDQRALLLSDPTMAKPMVEELLRWVSPTKNRLRIATKDFDFHGKRIKTGDWVIGFLASANKDETVFPDPHRFDITRTPNEHLAMGSGIHLCLGRALARLELGTLIPKVLRTFPDLEPISDGEPNWIADRIVTGFTSMPVRYTPVAATTNA